MNIWQFRCQEISIHQCASRIASRTLYKSRQQERWLNVSFSSEGLQYTFPLSKSSVVNFTSILQHLIENYVFTICLSTSINHSNHRLFTDEIWIHDLGDMVIDGCVTSAWGFNYLFSTNQNAFYVVLNSICAVTVSQDQPVHRLLHAKYSLCGHSWSLN